MVPLRLVAVACEYTAARFCCFSWSEGCWEGYRRRYGACPGHAQASCGVETVCAAVFQCWLQPGV